MTAERGTPRSAVNGVCPVLAVPFHADGSLDEAGFDRIVAMVLGAGPAAVTLFGLASEFYKLTDEERDVLLRRLLGATAGSDVSAVISVPAHATRAAVHQAETAVSLGADVINLLPPHFLKPSLDAVIAHISAVADAIDVPLMVQLAPGETGTNLPVGVLRELARRHQNFFTVKVETHPPGRMIAALAAGDPPLAGLVGYAGVQMPDALERGAVGVQPGCSFTELYVDLWHRFSAGDPAGFHRLHTRMLPYLTYWMQNVELIIQVEKTILARRGIIGSDHCRRPGWDLDDSESKQIDRFLADFSEDLG